MFSVTVWYITFLLPLFLFGTNLGLIWGCISTEKSSVSFPPATLCVWLESLRSQQLNIPLCKCYNHMTDWYRLTQDKFDIYINVVRKNREALCSGLPTEQQQVSAICRHRCTTAIKTQFWENLDEYRCATPSVASWLIHLSPLECAQGIKLCICCRSCLDLSLTCSITRGMEVQGGQNCSMSVSWQRQINKWKAESNVRIDRRLVEHLLCL